MRRHSLPTFAVYPLAAFLLTRDRDRIRGEWRSQKRARSESYGNACHRREGKRFSEESDTADEDKLEIKESHWMFFLLNRA